MKTKKSKESVMVENIAEDHNLVSLIKGGDQMAFTKLYNKYKGSVQFYVMKLTKQDVELTKDLCSEIFAKVFEKIALFKQESGAVSTWIFKIAKNQYIDYLRTNKHEVISLETLTPNGEEDSDLAFQVKCTEPTPYAELVKNESAKIIRDSIDSLKNAELRTVMKLRYLDELSYEEITEKMNIPEGTVKSLIHRAKAKLKEHMLGNKLLVA